MVPNVILAFLQVVYNNTHSGGHFTPLLAIVMAFIGKHILDLLSTSGTQDISYARNTLVLLFLGLASIYILRLVSCHAVQYSQSMQSEMLNGEIAITMMERAISADLEFFDNPEYYDIHRRRCVEL